MVKHLIGFGLFISIVTFFGLAFAFFTAEPIATVFVIENPPELRTHRDHSQSVRIGAPWVIADRSRGEVTIYINDLFGTVDPSVREFKANFTFYAVSGDEVRLVAIIDDSLVNTTRRDFNAKWTLRYDAGWLKKLAWEDNLYVVPTAWEDASASRASEFSKETAIPVLVRN